jgi:pimeloyl-ACP methyl ester carboxylesterase
MFDNLSFGRNPRDGECLVDRSKPENIDEWLIEYWERWVEQAQLPEKFLISGHSFGAYQAALYASRHPERIIKAFFISPANFEPYVSTKTYDPYSYRTDDSRNPPPRWMVNRSMDVLRSDRSMQTLIDRVPESLIRRIARGRF